MFRWSNGNDRRGLGDGGVMNGGRGMGDGGGVDGGRGLDGASEDSDSSIDINQLDDCE